jgi:hypothetical protein
MFRHPVIMPCWHTWICDYYPAEFELVPKGYISHHSDMVNDTFASSSALTNSAVTDASRSCVDSRYSMTLSCVQSSTESAPIFYISIRFSSSSGSKEATTVLGVTLTPFAVLF